MSDASSKKATLFLQSGNQDLQFILSKLKKLAELTEHITPFLEPSLRSYCQVANIHDNCITFIAANGAVATQLHYNKTELLQKWKQDPILAPVKDIRVKISPKTTISRLSESNKHSSPKPIPPLSLATANIVREIAGSISDTTLRDILEKIASHTK